ncbi:superoxide dismutase [Fe] [bacterium]|nr:superoxide dismutase [Fe] [bacterium]
MTHELPPLPYKHDALAPHISQETLEYHHDKHHATYVSKLNNLIPDTEFESRELEDIVRTAPAGGIFNNAAQVWNHTFYFAGMTPGGGGAPGGPIAEAIDARWGGFEVFRKEFDEAAAGNFGSGWTWLVRTGGGDLEIVNTSNAGCPITDGHTPLLCVDVWEHAYYIDTRNARPKYLENWWNVVDWNMVNERFSG